MIDTRSLFSDLKQALGRVTSEPVDKVNANPDTPVSLIVTLCEMLSPGQDYYRATRNPGSTIRHLFFTFLALSTRDHCSEFSQHTNLGCHCVLAKHGIYLHIISGNLEQWRSALINCNSEITEHDFRLLFNQFLFEFEQLGLKDLWFNYQRQQLNDETIKLLGYNK